MSDQTSTPPPPNHPISAALARALAEAADGLAGPHPVTYLVARYTRLGTPQGRGFDIRPFSSWDAVPVELREQVHSGERGFFGPYDTRSLVSARGRPVGEIDLHIGGSQPWVQSIPANHFDTLFYSAPAVEKFALPYYERIYGPEFAAQVMVEFAAAEVQVMAHFPWSEYTDDPGAGHGRGNIPMLLLPTGGTEGPGRLRPGEFAWTPVVGPDGLSPVPVVERRPSARDAAARGYSGRRPRKMRSRAT